mgnify:CR=1 FL=1
MSDSFWANRRLKPNQLTLAVCYAQLFAVQSRYYKENPVTGGPDETAVQHTAPGRQKEDTTHA